MILFFVGLYNSQGRGCVRPLPALHMLGICSSCKPWVQTCPPPGSSQILEWNQSVTSSNSYEQLAIIDEGLFFFSSCLQMYIMTHTIYSRSGLVFDKKYKNMNTNMYTQTSYHRVCKLGNHVKYPGLGGRKADWIEKFPTEIKPFTDNFWHSKMCMLFIRYLF